MENEKASSHHDQQGEDDDDNHLRRPLENENTSSEVAAQENEDDDEDLSDPHMFLDTGLDVLDLEEILAVILRYFVAFASGFFFSIFLGFA